MRKIDVIFITLIVAILTMGVFLIISIGAETTAACKSFGDQPLDTVPARCFKELSR